MSIRQFFIDLLVFLIVDWAICTSNSYLFMLIYFTSCSFHTCLYL